MAVSSPVAIPTLHNRLIGDCLADVEGGLIVRVAPILHKKVTRYWNRSGNVTWIDPDAAMRLIDVQYQVSAWLIEPGEADRRRWELAMKALLQSLRCGRPPLICLPRMNLECQRSSGSDPAADFQHVALEAGCHLDVAQVPDQHPMVLMFDADAPWSTQLTRRLAKWTYEVSPLHSVAE